MSAELITEQPQEDRPGEIVFGIGTHRGPFNLELTEEGTLGHKRVGAGGVAPSISVLVKESPIPIVTSEWNCWVNTPHSGWFTRDEIDKIRAEQADAYQEEAQVGSEQEDDEPGGLSEALRAAVIETKQKMDIIVVPNVPSRRNLRSYKGIAQEFWRINHGMLEFVQHGADWSDDFSGYRKVNHDLARTMAIDAMKNAALHPGAGIELRFDDFQVQLGPAEARIQLASFDGYKRIGYFGHTPFATPEEFSRVPEDIRKEVLKGILGADLVGFHTKEWVGNFIACVSKYLHDEVEIFMSGDMFMIKYDNRIVKVKDFPIGIDVESFSTVMKTPQVLEKAQRIRDAHLGKQIVLKNGRGDPSKRLVEAVFEDDMLLREYPQHRGSVVFYTRAPKSRKGVPENAAVDRRLMIANAQMNEDWGEGTMVLHQDSVGMQQLGAEYNAADVFVVSSRRDGFVLLVPEIATGGKDDIVMIVSIKAGAHDIYPETLPYDPDNSEANVETLHRALIMPQAERVARAQDSRMRAAANSNRDWARNYSTVLLD